MNAGWNKELKALPIETKLSLHCMSLILLYQPAPPVTRNTIS